MAVQPEIYQMYNNKETLIQERTELIKQLQSIEEMLVNLQNQCSHKLVLAFEDNGPHKIGKIIRCSCPICGKKENIYLGNENENCAFKDSKLINLSKIPIDDFNEHFPSIIEHILINYDFCCCDGITEKNIAKAIITLVETRKEEDPKIKKLIPNKQKDD